MVEFYPGFTYTVTRPGLAVVHLIYPPGACTYYNIFYHMIVTIYSLKLAYS